MVYNVSAFNNTETTFLTYFQFANDATSGWFGIMFVLAIYTISFMALNGLGNKNSISASAVVVLVFSILARAFGVIPDIALMTALALTALSGVYLYISR